jgi:hypothetical protein
LIGRRDDLLVTLSRGDRGSWHGEACEADLTVVFGGTQYRRERQEGNQERDDGAMGTMS